MDFDLRPLDVRLPLLSMREWMAERHAAKRAAGVPEIYIDWEHPEKYRDDDWD